MDTDRQDYKQLKKKVLLSGKIYLALFSLSIMWLAQGLKQNEWFYLALNMSFKTDVGFKKSGTNLPSHS